MIAMGRNGRAHGVIGHGADDFAAAKVALQNWKAHAGFGVRIEPSDAPIAVGSDVVVVARVFGVTIHAPCRITSVIDEPSRYGFEYETRAGHPLRGKELFLVEQAVDGTVTFTVEAESVPQSVLARVGLPYVRYLQGQARAAFVKGMVQS